MTWRPRLGGLIFIGLGLVAAALLYLMYLNPVAGEEIVPAGHARNTSSYVTMRDGTRLAADVWVPSHLGVDQRLPAIMITTRRRGTPWDRSSACWSAWTKRVPNIAQADQWNDAGYAWSWWTRAAVARRRPAPGGWSDAEVADLGEVTEWITGNHGRTARSARLASYSGNTAELSPSRRTPALRAVAPLCSIRCSSSSPCRGLTTAAPLRWNTANRALDANDLALGRSTPGCWWLKLAVPGVAGWIPRRGLLRDAVAGRQTLDLAEALRPCRIATTCCPGPCR
jgi:hypothetical protein